MIDVDLQLEKGGSLALIGANGAGKSTLLLVLAGLRRASSGTWRVNGSIGLLPERPALPARLTARQSLMHYGRVHGIAEEGLADRVDMELARLDLSTHAETPIRALSLGGRQRTALAQALLHRPDVLLLDEPLGGLDPDAARVLVALLADERQRGVSLLIATHRLLELSGVCDRVAQMRDGTLHDLGSCEAVLDRLPVRITFGLPGSDAPAGLACHRSGDLWSSVVGPDERSSAVKQILDAGGGILRLEPELGALTTPEPP